MWKSFNLKTLLNIAGDDVIDSSFFMPTWRLKPLTSGEINSKISKQTRKRKKKRKKLKTHMNHKTSDFS